MTDVNLMVYCGCGYRTKSLEEAVKHSESTNHSMVIQGTIIPDKKPVVVSASTPNKPSKPRKQVQPEQPELADLSAIDALRQKFSNGGK